MTSNSLGGQLWPRLELRVRVLWWEELDWPWEQVSAHALDRKSTRLNSSH